MNSTELRDLLEAYSEVYTPEEYVDEIVERVADDTGETGRGPRLIDAYNKAPYSDDKDSAKNPIPIKLKRKGPKMKGVVRKEETDLFDYLLEYLVAEGYADTNKAALAIMANMSEEWKQSIVEADSIAAMRERAAKRRKQRYGDERFGRDDFKSNEQKKKEADARMQAYLDSKAKERG